jgi:exosortase/archaeosortase family protein
MQVTSSKKAVIRFLVILALLIAAGAGLRMMYHSFSGVSAFIGSSIVIDTLYRMLMGPVDFLLSLTDIPHSLRYSTKLLQYFIYLPHANVSLYLWIPCLGLSIMYIYTSLILAYPNAWKVKLVYIVAGNILIQVLNILRLYGLLLLIHSTHTVHTVSKTLPWLAVNHETIFNYGVILIVFIVFAIYAGRNKRKPVEAGN